MGTLVEDHGVYPIHNLAAPSYTYASRPAPETYARLSYPLPVPSHANYPHHTPGGGDKRRLGEREMRKEGLCWVGGLM
ncbi:hypothetical protein C0993_003026 [Termitomyces sp. T159_Od127]|nr:hypothetical protein C0993_003026 [Termitomyces sp. T159_Od127]